MNEWNTKKTWQVKEKTKQNKTKQKQKQGELQIVRSFIEIKEEYLTVSESGRGSG